MYLNKKEREYNLQIVYKIDALKSMIIQKSSTTKIYYFFYRKYKFYLNIFIIRYIFIYFKSHLAIISRYINPLRILKNINILDILININLYTINFREFEFLEKNFIRVICFEILHKVFIPEMTHDTVYNIALKYISPLKCKLISKLISNISTHRKISPFFRKRVLEKL